MGREKDRDREGCSGRFGWVWEMGGKGGERVPKISEGIIR